MNLLTLWAYVGKSTILAGETAILAAILAGETPTLD
jgi:hypothetical protein